MLGELTVLDAHMHYAYPIREDSLIDVLRETGVDRVLLAALPGGQRLDPTPDILALKARYPQRIFAFGCLDCTAYYKPRTGLSRRFIRRTEQLMKAGCDGLKMFEGKPTMRRQYPIPDFDDACWEPFWSYAEEVRLPILFHINDPASFWDTARASLRAREQGWLYGEDTIKDSEQYRQLRCVMEKHEKLNICFAHMFFLSAQLPRLTEWMERFPNMRVDLTPAVEVLKELSETPEETRTFLERFQDRVLYGTDTGGRAVLEGARKINAAEARKRAELVRALLNEKSAIGIRSDGDYLVGVEPFVLRGMGLEADVLRKLLCNNFLTFVGRDTPSEVDIKRTERLCRTLMRRLRSEARRRHESPDLSGVQNALDRLTLMQEDNEEV